jgi:hypothetical protein
MVNHPCVDLPIFSVFTCYPYKIMDKWVDLMELIVHFPIWLLNQLQNTLLIINTIIDYYLCCYAFHS